MKEHLKDNTVVVPNAASVVHPFISRLSGSHTRAILIQYNNNHSSQNVFIQGKANSGHQQSPSGVRKSLPMLMTDDDIP